MIISAAMVLVSALATAVNVWFYVATANPLNLAVAVFCGLVTVFNIAAFVVIAGGRHR